MSEEAPANAPVAPAEPSTPAAPAPETPAAPASEPQAQAPATAPAEGANSYFTNEQLAEMQSFIHNNGDFEKAWPRMKNAISRPQNVPETPQAPQTVQQPAAQPQVPQNGSQQPIEGTYSMEELMVASQFEKYAAKPEYAGIADEIKSGEVLKGLKDFNINVVENGRFNDVGIRKYLDLYSASKPAKPTSVEPANDMAMADDLSNIKEITSMDEANRIQLDDIRRRNAGQSGNPLAAKAKEYIKNYYAELAKTGRF